MNRLHKGKLLHLPLRAYCKIEKWANRVVETSPRRDTDFLPGALEVVETPPSPTGRMIMKTIILFVVVTIVWSSLSKIDVVATAAGKIISSGKAKVIQASEIGVIKEIAVKEGQHVNKGDLLILLDSTLNEADLTELHQKLTRARCESILLNALQRWTNSGEIQEELVFSEGVNENLKKLYRNRFEYELRSIIDKLSVINSEINANKAHRVNIRHQIQKEQSVLEIITKRTEAMKQLYKEQSASEHDWLFQEQKRISAEQDLESTRQEELECLSTIEKLKNDKNQILSEFRRDTLHKKADNQDSIETILQRLAKAQRRQNLRHLTAPVTGEVQQLSVHTIGGVVKEAQPLMVVTPDSDVLEVEASILNRDIGFVKEGQNAEVKLEAFPYTEYGAIPGEVLSVSKDAVQDKDGNLTFLCRVKLLQSYILVNGQKVKLSPGMRASAEVTLRKRRLISYFLSPLMKYKAESLRER
ncbi:HlyD family type I secretion periplasmic adaptor subunit [Maridesulfovibrio zosterae]|uniref:HlyD family type I secretion periplasmic adaptor subunit n=1 Tax=Maridesulfovibrio zosterae TaxID=82171 RepID=UPI0004199E10|nr:HlyD family type I secretion periplasmic adaptor subunit [Maridesulfovibrio zosterae]